MRAGSLAGGASRIHAVSDIHTNYALNMEWARSLASEPAYRRDVLLLAGDVSDKLDLLRETLEVLASSFGAVFFVPGNHDMWCRRDGSEGADSLDKLRRLDEVCSDLGVLTTPQRVSMADGGCVSILPLLSFHHISFDTEPDVTGLRLPSAKAIVSDYKATRWPDPLACGEVGVAQLLDDQNDSLPGARATAQAQGRARIEPLLSYAQARDGGARIISFSHFLPRIELLPEKRFLIYPPLMSAVGSHPLGRRVATLRPDLHVFGHTHFGWDAQLDGVRYVQAALATPAERSGRPRSLQVGNARVGVEGGAMPLCIYDSGAGGFCAPHFASWSEHYASNPRTPAVTEPAPWVLAHYRRKAPHRLRPEAKRDREGRLGGEGNGSAEPAQREGPEGVRERDVLCPAPLPAQNCAS
jgi:predicted phosphodiesterase